MATTKKILSEQILRILTGGFPSARSRFKESEIALAIGQVASQLLKTETLGVNFTFDGGSIPDGALLATYENVPLKRGYGKSCYADLPAMPMMLPKRMGVFSVFPSGYPEKELMPIPSGVYNTWINEKILNPLNTMIYSWDSRRVTIYDDLVGAGVQSVDIKLAVVDVATLSDNDILPLSADLENKVIELIVARFQGEPDTTRSETNNPSPSKNG